MRDWAYIRQMTLNKLDLPSEEADSLGYLDRFPFYANEAMTQICTMKPKRDYFVVEILPRIERQKIWDKLVTDYNAPYLSIIPKPNDSYSKTINGINFWTEWETYHFVGDQIIVGPDFIGFNDDVPTYSLKDCKGQYIKFYEAHDSDFEYLGYNKIFCKHEGLFTIPYNARWFTFDTETAENYKIDAPDDVLDCIPSYIVSQLFKIDDEYKASVYRNEYEIFLARIDNTDYRNSRTIEIGGDW